MTTSNTSTLINGVHTDNQTLNIGALAFNTNAPSFDNDLFHLVKGADKFGIVSLAIRAVLLKDTSKGFNSAILGDVLNITYIADKAYTKAGVTKQVKAGSRVLASHSTSESTLLSRVTSYITKYPSNETELSLAATLTASRLSGDNLNDLADYVIDDLASANMVWQANKADFTTIDKVPSVNIEDDETPTPTPTPTPTLDDLSDTVTIESDNTLLAIAAINSLVIDVMACTKVNDAKSLAQTIGKLCENMLGDEVASTDSINELIAKFAA